jgi:hypothetical protein
MLLGKHEHPYTLFSLRVPTRLLAHLRDQAKRDGRSLSDLCRYLLDDGLAAIERRPGHETYTLEELAVIRQQGLAMSLQNRAKKRAEKEAERAKERDNRAEG